MSKPAPAITNLRYYKNETKAGNPTATKARQGVHYYTNGTGKSREELEKESGIRGNWYNSKGQQITVPEMVEWTAQKATENKYTYTAVLSLRDGDMTAEDFHHAMSKQQQFDDWRFIVHDDTKHTHAHVMMYRDKTLSRAEFNDWRHTVGHALEVAELERITDEPKKKEQYTWGVEDLEPDYMVISQVEGLAAYDEFDPAPKPEKAAYSHEEFRNDEQVRITFENSLMKNARAGNEHERWVEDIYIKEHGMDQEVEREQEIEQEQDGYGLGL